MTQTATGWRASRRRNGASAVLTMLWAVAALSFASGGSPAAGPIAVAVADFDYFDTSGEVLDQSAEHQARVASFAALLRDNLAAQGDYRVVPIECPDHPCTATSMSQDVFIAAARKAGARLVVYGGIRKMSTLVQWGEIQLLDLEAEKLLMRRTVTFRGDNDAAYRHAADFVGNTLKESMPKP
ncbi:DUF2380 domain-containing protein [Bradyrhizobium australiense]|uniref:DUF2380 domain-containing protein n=1 Tax=Bradyrhizobium australiense TaxID=2721161 RepID=A0A7Y4GM27_9BRAD|nr:DUF2380 domain-containing protein [Bradyrhizobium australiense]NOJ38211.1 DUF2380 domain-containing protein [Bradyrhizobium australiense]